MAASPQVITNYPLYLTANTLIHSARDFRKPFSDIVGQGVMDYDSFRIRQRAAGANMSVDCQTASVLNRAWVRCSTSTDGGLYRADFNSATPTNLDVAAADPTNPRIDQVYLCIEDSQETGANNRCTVRMVTGTATGGATLDNRTGVGAAPAGMSSFLLADVLVAAAAASIANAVIRDRRPFAVLGAIPPTFTGLDVVVFQPSAGLATGLATIQTTASADAKQAAALMYLPRRIVGATKIRFKYAQGSTANAANYNIGIYDASGRQIVTTGATAYTGTASQVQTASLTITTTTFDAGYYWIWLGNAAGTGSASVTANGVAGTGTGPGPMTPNLYATAASGGTTAPTTILALTDFNTVSGANVNNIGVPSIGLSVG